MFIAVNFSFDCIGCELIKLPVVVSIKATCASLVRIKTISVADSLSVSLSSFFTLLSGVSGEVLTAIEMIGDFELDTESATNKTEGDSVSRTATCNKVVTILDSRYVA